MDIVKVLVKARGYIESKDRWIQREVSRYKYDHGVPVKCFCAAGAVIEASVALVREELGIPRVMQLTEEEGAQVQAVLDSAFFCLAEEMPVKYPVDTMTQVTSFNDFNTHEAVMRAFDAAIAKMSESDKSSKGE